MSELVLPTINSTNKALLLFTGGLDSVYDMSAHLANAIIERDGSLENVISLYLPLQHLVAGLSTDDDYQVYLEEVSKFHFSKNIMLKDKSLLTFENGDNLIDDSGRIDFHTGLIALLKEKGLGSYAKTPLIICYNKRIFEHQKLLSNVVDNPEVESEYQTEILNNPNKYPAILNESPDAKNFESDNTVANMYPYLKLFDLEKYSKRTYLSFPYKNMNKAEIKTLIGTS